MHAKYLCYPSSFLDNPFTLSSDANMTNVSLTSSVANEHVHNPLSVIAFLEMRFVVCTCEDNVSGVQISDACCYEECK